MLIYIDVTELLKVNFVSGIQRVVIEVLTNWIECGNLNLKLLNYNDNNQTFVLIKNQDFYDVYKAGADKNILFKSMEQIKIEEFEEGSVFFDIDSVWMNFLKRSWLLPKIKKQKVKIAALIYDIIPITESQFCHEFTVYNFIEYLGSHLKYSDLIISNTQATIQSFLNLQLPEMNPGLKTAVVPLGSDFNENNKASIQVNTKIMETVSKNKYILMVGTLEPRKNHAYILDAFESGLFDEGFNLIIAGRVGWNVNELLDRIYTHELFGRQLFYIDNASDSDIDYLYKNAFAVAFASYNEGYGLPLIEAFDRMVPVFASDIPVFHEVAGDYCEYFDLLNPVSFYSLVKRFESDKVIYNSFKSMLKEYKKNTWKQVSLMMEREIRNLL